MFRCIVILAIIYEAAGLCYYDLTNATCCQGEIVPGGNLACCGHKGFDPNKQICCDFQNGSLLSVPNGSPYEWGCCNNQLHRLTESLCCNEKLVPFPNETASQRRYSCCEDTAYNRFSHLCCQGKVFNRTNETQSCCADRVYNLDTQQCCDGKNVYRKTSQTQSCCGSRIYNWKNQTCKYPEEIVQKKPSAGELCGKNVVVNYETQRCCNGNYYDVASERIQCCLGNLFNVTNQVCCESDGVAVIHNKVPHFPIGCCGTKAYNYDIQACCSGKVVDLMRSTGHEKVPCCQFT